MISEKHATSFIIACCCQDSCQTSAVLWLRTYHSSSPQDSCTQHLQYWGLSSQHIAKTVTANFSRQAILKETTANQTRAFFCIALRTYLNVTKVKPVADGALHVVLQFANANFQRMMLWARPSVCRSYRTQIVTALEKRDAKQKEAGSPKQRSQGKKTA